MTNINQITRRYIDSRAEIRKTLIEGLINTSALARMVAKEYGLKKNINAIISAIRRYETDEEIVDRHNEIIKVISEAKISTRTKLSSIIINRNDETEKKVANIHSKIPLKRDTTLRSIELTNYIKFICDDDLIPHIKKVFFQKDIIRIDYGLGELDISFKKDLSKIAGILSTFSNELAINDISIVYSINSHWEHIIVFKEQDLQKALSVILNMTKVSG